MKAQVADVLGDIPLEEKIHIAEEIANVPRMSMTAQEVRNIDFMVPYLRKDFYTLSDEEKEKFLAKIHGTPTPVVVAPVVSPVIVPEIKKEEPVIVPEIKKEEPVIVPEIKKEEQVIVPEIKKEEPPVVVETQNIASEEQEEPVEQTEPQTEDIPMPITKEENTEISEEAKIEEKLEEAIANGEYRYQLAGDSMILQQADLEAIDKIQENIQDR